ncbi:MAG: LysR family transcriptional regulator [Jannaschia helgolandensis]|uniref:Transcriptional regulator, LysR family n=1 Tax=Jannaschia helgolandensis TaxID=188906 RepID=A0A1H7Q7S1_9RHOB|nr:LysR family transcriptional regulator [Jannaschia helgolandensis]SEL43839.1 transcriptional regulator, LysR family [Jannaschia helgolandensis]|tara:strand:+ start:2198 stop:3073 length:876 start_codon:yes stop_codon:yes gene_type:complete
MTLEQLRAFLWVARLGGVRKAGARLNVSQPAVSARIATLEAELQQQLFDRAPGGFVLTRQGQLLITYAEQMLFVEEEIRKRVSDPAETQGLFRIGASETIAQSWLPAFIKAFSADYPQVTLDLTVDISINLRTALLERRLDLAFLMGPVSEFTVENVALPQFDLHWFRARGADKVDLARVPVISYATKTRPFRELSEMLTRRYGPSVRIYSSASLSASLKMIAAGVAVGPYPRALARGLLDAGEIEEFDPGFQPSPLEFTASYLADPRRHLAETGAAMARTVAEAWSGNDP